MQTQTPDILSATKPLKSSVSMQLEPQCIILMSGTALGFHIDKTRAAMIIFSFPQIRPAGTRPASFCHSSSVTQHESRSNRSNMYLIACYTALFFIPVSLLIKIVGLLREHTSCVAWENCSSLTTSRQLLTFTERSEESRQPRGVPKNRHVHYNERCDLKRWRQISRFCA